MKTASRLKPKTKAKTKFSVYIICDNNGGYWSEEEGGRFSGGALYEKVFATEAQAEKYKQDKKINGSVQPISNHWIGSMSIIFDSSKPSQKPLNLN